MKSLKVLFSVLVLSAFVVILTNGIQGLVRANTVMTMTDNNIQSVIFPDYIGSTPDGKKITRTVTQRLCAKCYTKSSLVNEYTYYIDGNVALKDSRFEFLSGQPKFGDTFKF